MSTEQYPLIGKLVSNNRKRLFEFPNPVKAKHFAEELFAFLFVCELEEASDSEKLLLRYKTLMEELTSLLRFISRDETFVSKQVNDFFNSLSVIYDALIRDADAIFKGDPAAKSLGEVVAAYPGFFATFIYRISHQLHLQGIEAFPRYLSEYAHSKTGIDIHPGASIGYDFAIDHGTGIVIGETAIIGNEVRIYQGVTLGALSVSKEATQMKRHPTIENNVVIYAGATILGGDTIIGAGSIIGGNVWLTYSVPTNSVVYHKSEIHVKDNNPFPEPLNFVI